MSEPLRQAVSSLMPKLMMKAHDETTPGRYDDIAPDLRIQSPDYGTGTVRAIVPSGVQVWWDEPLKGTQEHMLVHDRSFIAGLERI